MYSARPLIDVVDALRLGAYLGYPATFVLASALTLVGTALLVWIRKAAKVPGT